MKILVCGGAGFIGSHVVDALVGQGEEVLCLDSLDPGVHHAAPSYLRREVEYCFADLRNWRPDGRFDDVEAVVHLAALGGVGRAGREPGNVLTANAGGTAQLVEHLRRWPRLRRFVLVSSFSVYGGNYRYRCPACGQEQGAERSERDLAAGQYEVLCRNCGGTSAVLPITEAAAPDPLETYGASKYMQELCLRGLPAGLVFILRLSSVYGPRLRLDDGEATIVAKLAGWIRAGVAPQLYEDGGQIRDWVYVGDVVAAVLAMLRSGTEPLVNVCTGQGTTLLQACAELARVLGRSCQPEVVGGFRPGDMRHCLGDPARLQRLLGRAPTGFAEGVGRAFAESS